MNRHQQAPISDPRADPGHAGRPGCAGQLAADNPHGIWCIGHHCRRALRVHHPAGCTRRADRRAAVRRFRLCFPARALAMPAPGSPGARLRLDGVFGLHPSLAFLHECFSAKELIVLHAVASPYRERSHFDGQDVLESGVARPHASESGWLNRALAAQDASRRPWASRLVPTCRW